VVILQEDIPELTEHCVAPFFEQARLFDRETRELSSKTVLFMAWVPAQGWAGARTTRKPTV